MLDKAPVPDEILRTLQQLQRHNGELLRELHRQSQATAEAQRALEDIYSSRWHRLLVLAFGSVHARRRRFVISILQARRTWKHFGSRHLLRSGWRRLRRIMAGCDLLPTAATGPLPSPEESRQSRYEEWIARREPDEVELQRQRSVRLPREPLISLVVPVYRTPLPFLMAMVESVREQTYSNWELCIADGGSGDSVLRCVLESFSRSDERILVRFLETNRGIAGNANAALQLAHGEFVGFLDHDDTLAPFALFEVARALNDEPDADLLYSDEDKIDETGQRRFHPGFKPAWSPDTLRSHNYVCHLAVYRRTLLNELGGVREGFDGAQDYDLVLRAGERARQIVHIPKVLYHWRSHAGSTAQHLDVKPEAAAAARRAVSDHLARLGIEGEVASGPDGFTCRVRRAVRRRPLISVVIPNRDARQHLKTCLQSVAASNYDHLEVLIVENNSSEPATFRFYDELTARDPRIRVLAWQGPFNYGAIHNWAVREARGEILLFLNNDVEARHSDWIERMLEHAVRDDVGAVGAKLFYPDGTIQHAGVVVGMDGVAGHGHRGYPEHSPGDRHRLLVIQNLSAVTAACLMMRKDVYDAVGGFDERFAVAFNDVDLCLKIRQLEKLIVWTPLARLWHHESLTRGPEDTPSKQIRFAREVQLFRDKWAEFLADGDPYYNPHLSHNSVEYVADPHSARPPRARSVTGTAGMRAEKRRAA